MMTSERAKRMEVYFDRLWPLNRAILGSDYRRSLDILSEIVPFQRLQYSSGSQAFDWRVPEEWSVREAYLIDPHGRRFCDVKENNLHLVSYSVAWRGSLSLEELKKHLHTLPEQPDAIPYVTSYYRPYWGFCLTHDEFQQLPDGEYAVCVDTEHNPGHLEVGECVLPGAKEEEIFFSSYLCHPSMANNELSGPLVLAFLAERIKALPCRRYSYRFLLNPETIGSLCYLTTHGEHLQKHLKAGFVLTCIGDRAALSYKRSRRGDSVADRYAEFLLKDQPGGHVYDFSPAHGSDERQYCSPGFNLPVGVFMRSMYNTFPEYHTSHDTKEFISFASLVDAVDRLFDLVLLFEGDRVYRNLHPFGEPQLGKRGLYPTTSGAARSLNEKVYAMLWVLNFSDGTNSLMQISERAEIPFPVIREAADELVQHGLLEEAGGS